MKKKLIRITTIPVSLDKLLDGQLNFMNSYYDVTVISSDKEYIKKIGMKEKVDTFHLEMTRKITPIKDFIAVLKLTLYLVKAKPFILHSHTPKAGIVAMLAAKIAGVPNRLHTVAGLPLLEATGSKRKILDFVEKLTYSCATKVYPNSYGLEQIIIENKYCSQTKLKVIANGSSNGINTSLFNANHFSDSEKNKLKQELSINNDDFVYVFVGRIVADKGINELVAAFKKLSSNQRKCKLLLVGPLEEELNPLQKDTLFEIHNNKSIIMVGYKNDVRPYFSISNCLVFPSYREGFPNVVMQAGAMELPSIVSNINGCNEIIKDNNNGIIIPVKNENAIFAAMEKILFNAPFFDELKRNSRSYIVSQFEQKVVWNALLDEYKMLEKNV